MSEVGALLKAIPLFSQLDDDEILQVEKVAEVDGKLKGDVLFQKGDETDSFYVVARGQVEIVLDDERVALGKGEFFGEMGVINSAPRNADAVASEDSVLVRIPKEHFDRLLAMDEKLEAKVLEVCQRRGGSHTGGIDTGLVVFYSPRGGAGTTSLAVNFACRLADLRKKPVGLLDGDLQFGNTHLMIPGAAEAKSLTEAVRDGSVDDFELGQVTCETDRGVHLVRSPKKTEEAELVSAGELARVATLLTERVDLVVADTSSALDDKTLALIDAATLVMLVVEPEIVAVQRAADCLRLFEIAGFDLSKIQVVLNKAGRGLPRAGVEKVLGRNLYAEVQWTSKAFDDAIHDGTPVVDGERTSRAVIDLTNFVRRFLNPLDPALRKDSEKTTGKQGFSLWNFLMGDEEAAPAPRA